MKQIKIISKAAVFALLAIGTFNSIQAQGQRPPERKGQMERPKMDPKKLVQEQMGWFEKNFELSEDQSKKIEEIHINDAEKKKAIMDSGLTPRDSEFREKMEGMDILKESELQEVLSEEQWLVFEKYKEDYMKIGRPDRTQRRGKNK